MHSNSKLLFERYAKPHFHDGAKVLEIGPNDFPSSYCKLVGKPQLQWDTLDIYESPKLTYSKSPEYQFAIPDNTYDIVLSGQVMEHVPKIWLWIRELERVTKPGGLVIILSPVSWPYHEAPIDCWRIYPEGMKALLSETSLEPIHCQYESLEAPGYKDYLPGRSLEWVGARMQRFYKWAGRFGYPVERAYDLMTIARKRATA